MNMMSKSACFSCSKSWPLHKPCLRTLLCCLILSILGTFATSSPNQEEVRLHYLTDWKVEPSFKYDALCFLNALTADPFYLKHYQAEYEAYALQLPESVKESLANLKQLVKDKNRLIISAFLCLYFSSTSDETLDDMLETLDDTDQMHSNLKNTAYYTVEGWRLFESLRDDLKIIILFLKHAKFESYWTRFILPVIKTKILQVQKHLPKYNITYEVEALLGSPLPSHKITVYLLYFSKPHALKITGTRYLTNVDWPLEIALRNAVHELMHPPFDLMQDAELRQAISLLQQDDFLRDKFLNHDPSFGYNTFEGFVEEDCVQALEQIINERLGIAVEAHNRWQEADGGMHVLAVALYTVMKTHDFNQKGERFRDFLIRIIRSGDIAPGKIKELYDAFYKTGLTN